MALRKRSQRQRRPGRQFEKAVHDFVSRLLPGARVFFNHFVPDIVTRKKRQVDIWVEGLINGHFPITVHISCKDHSRPIDLQQLDAFVGEFRSTGASTGIIYARSGFTRPAVEKAGRLGISCCRLYDDAPADTPEIVWAHQYLGDPTFRLIGPERDERRLRKTWGDLLSAVVDKEGRTTLDILDQGFHELQTKAIEEATRSGDSFPRPHARRYSFEPEDGSAPFTLILETGFVIYRGRVEAHIASGSYCANTKQFHGSLAGPAIDLHSGEPGEGWEPIETLPDPRDSYTVMLPRRRFLRGLLPDNFDQRPLDEPADLSVGKANASSK